MSRAVEAYRISEDKWYSKTPLPTDGVGNWEKELTVALGTASYAEVGGKGYIYVMSGINSLDFDEYRIIGYNDSIMRYSIDDNEWDHTVFLRSDEYPLSRRISPNSIVYDGKFIVFGGAIDKGSIFNFPAEDFYIDISVTDLSTKLYTDIWIKSGSGYLGGFPEPKFQSSLIKYDTDPSDVDGVYYIMGGGNSYSSSLDINERIVASGSSFLYESSYEESSSSISPMLKAKYGMSIGLCYADSKPYIYVAGGFVTDKEDGSIDIGFNT